MKPTSNIRKNKEGAALLVHSSLRSFGRVEGGADAVVDGILEYWSSGSTSLYGLKGAGKQAHAETED